MTVSLAPPASTKRSKIRREERVGLAERVGELDAVDAAPAPAVGVAAEALLEPVESGLERLERDLVPRPPPAAGVANQAGSPSSQSSSMRAWKRHGEDTTAKSSTPDLFS